jgi:hypothetical protein
VNFAATLFAGGRIVYHYGAGNKNLGVSGRLAGCSNSSPMVGLALGNETFGQFAFTHDGAGTLENARQVVWEPPFANQGGPVGVLESPAPGATVSDLLTVSGAAWDADPGMAVRRVDILIDGFPFPPAATGQINAGFCNAQRVPGCPFVGFFRQLNIRALGLKAGRHTIQVRATNWRGVMETFPAEPVEFHVGPGESGGVSGALEEPSNGAVVSGTFPVVGHVLSQTLRIAGVDVLLDGINYGRPPLNVARTDVCGPIQNRSTTCPAPGFRFNMNTRSSALPVADGAHTLQIRVQDESGRFTMLPEQPLAITVANGGGGSPRGVADSPRTNERLRGVVRFSGYAYDPGGRITNVTLFVDGSAFSNVPYGQPRPDTCTALTGVAACPNIGFAIDFDTRRLPDGPHVIGFSATNDQGTAVRFPVEVANGVNVFVEN